MLKKSLQKGSAPMLLSWLHSVPHLGDWLLMASSQVALWALILWGIYRLTRHH
jgi:hypothetical protein